MASSFHLARSTQLRLAHQSRKAELSEIQFLRLCDFARECVFQAKQSLARSKAWREANWRAKTQGRIVEDHLFAALRENVPFHRAAIGFAGSDTKGWFRLSTPW